MRTSFCLTFNKDSARCITQSQFFSKQLHVTTGWRLNIDNLIDGVVFLDLEKALNSVSYYGF